MKVKILSFGFKYNALHAAVVANLLFDVRFMENPHYDETLRPLSGKDAAVQQFVLSQEQSKRFVGSLRDLLVDLLNGYARYGHDHDEVVIAFGCTGGKHRSVTFALQCLRILGELNEDSKVSFESVEVVHRDLGRE